MTVRNILCCPQCKVELRDYESTNLQCSECAVVYLRNRSGQLDLRPRHPFERTLRFSVGSPYPTFEGIDLLPLKENPSPPVDLEKIAIPPHLTRELVSYFPDPKVAKKVLDLGCGDARHRRLCESLGYEYVGMDYSEDSAPMLADAHALPFVDASFDFVLSIAVFEHLRYPHLAITEVGRVLKTGGTFLGTVAFLEPFHQLSFFHHTHLGMVDVLEYGGFHVRKMCPSLEWHSLKAQAGMGMFPRLPRFLSTAIVWPTYAAHRLWWWAGRLFAKSATESDRALMFSGAFYFVATKR